MSPNSSPDNSPVLLKVKQAAERLYVSRSTAYNMVKSGEIKSVLIRRMIRIPETALNEYLANKLAAASPLATTE